jgi:TolA-binding protein
MRSNKLVVSLLLIVIMLIPYSSFLQKSKIYTHDLLEYNAAVSLYEKEKYGAARRGFEKFVEQSDDQYSITYIDAAYYIAQCALLTNSKDAEYQLEHFIISYPKDDRINSLHFDMGKLQYQKKSYAKVIKWMTKVDKTELSREQRIEYYFKKGYSHFVKEEDDEARIAFFEIKDVESEYNAAANYFYAHLAYKEGNFQTALNGFELLLTDEDFVELVPYYLIQIYFEQGNYDKIKDLGPELLAKATEKRVPEIARIIGEAHFRTNEFVQAIPYLQQYKEQTESYTREEIYQLGYAYYRAGNLPEAIRNFDKVARGNSFLAQNSYFHIADCYLQSGERKKAHMAFSSAAKMDFDQNITEESLFNEAKLSFELSYSPFNQTIRTFDEFVTKYPNSPYVDMAYDYLVKVFMATRNYGQALTYLDKIENPNENIRKAYQRVAFYRGVEYYTNAEFNQAVVSFKKSLEYGYINPEMKAKAIYWLGESNYRLKKYDEAIDWYNKYLRAPRAISQKEYSLAHYNLAYAYFKEEKYDEAVSWFRKFTTKNTESRAMICDSYVRVGDCYFKSRGYAEAVKYYDLAISMKLRDDDYSTYQKAFCYGLLKEHGKKNWVLRQMISDYPESGFRVNAMFELGRSYVQLEQSEMALETYQNLIKEFPESNFVKKAYNQIGLVYYNAMQNEEALVAYKKVVENYAESDEAKSALIGIRNIYMDLHKEDEYFAYAESLGAIASVSVTEKDSLTFYSAERLYMKGDCSEATEHLKKYIMNFGDGGFILNAHYYKADCNLQMKDELEALTSFNFIISRPRNKFTEEALLNAGKLNFKLKNYKGSLENYQTLESVADNPVNLLSARVGQMRSFFNLKLDSGAVLAANKVLISDNISVEIEREAHFVLAKSFYSMGEFESALNEFNYINANTQTLEGAEANFRIAEILYKQEKYKESEEAIMEFNRINTQHQFWLAKSIILLADLYVVNEDNFQARHTLESVIQYYDNQTDGIVEIAKDKLGEILEQEESETLFKEALEIKLEDMEMENESDSAITPDPLIDPETNENESESEIKTEIE